MGLQKLNKSR